MEQLGWYTSRLPHRSTVSESQEVGHSCLAWQLRPKNNKFTWWTRLWWQQEWTRVLQEFCHCQVIRHDIHFIKETETEKEKNILSRYTLNIYWNMCIMCICVNTIIMYIKNHLPIKWIEFMKETVVMSKNTLPYRKNLRRKVWNKGKMTSEHYEFFLHNIKRKQ